MKGKGRLDVQIASKIIRDFQLATLGVAKTMNLSKLEMFSCLLSLTNEIKESLENDLQIRIVNLEYSKEQRENDGVH